jgi:hypothetical protein
MRVRWGGQGGLGMRRWVREEGGGGWVIFLRVMMLNFLFIIFIKKILSNKKVA